MKIKFYNSKESEEDKAELERFQQANDFMFNSIVFNSPLEVGGFTKKYGYKYSKLSELKSYHFDFYFKPKYITKNIKQNIYCFNKKVWNNSQIEFIFKY